MQYVLKNQRLGPPGPPGRRVAGPGRGDTGALVGARPCVRLGAAEVHVACPESRETMPAHPWEIEAAEEEGVQVHPSTAFVQVVEQDGRATGLLCRRVRSMHFDEERRLHLDR